MTKRNFPRGAALLLVGVAVAYATFAQPVRRQVLKELEVQESGGCQRITATLQFPFALQGHFPPEHGALLAVEVIPLENDPVALADLVDREALVPASAPATTLQQVTWEGDAVEGPQVLFRFSHDVAYTVSGGADFRSIVVTLHPITKDPAPCMDRPSESGGAK